MSATSRLSSRSLPELKVVRPLSTKLGALGRSMQRGDLANDELQHNLCSGTQMKAVARQVDRRPLRTPTSWSFGSLEDGECAAPMESKRMYGPWQFPSGSPHRRLVSEEVARNLSPPKVLPLPAPPIGASHQSLIAAARASARYGPWRMPSTATSHSQPVAQDTTRAGAPIVPEPKAAAAFDPDAADAALVEKRKRAAINAAQIGPWRYPEGTVTRRSLQPGFCKDSVHVPTPWPSPMSESLSPILGQRRTTGSTRSGPWQVPSSVSSREHASLPLPTAPQSPKPRRPAYLLDAPDSPPWVKAGLFPSKRQYGPWRFPPDGAALTEDDPDRWLDHPSPWGAEAPDITRGATQDEDHARSPLSGDSSISRGAALAAHSLAPASAMAKAGALAVQTQLPTDAEVMQTIAVEELPVREDTDPLGATAMTTRGEDMGFGDGLGGHPAPTPKKVRKGRKSSATPDASSSMSTRQTRTDAGAVSTPAPSASAKSDAVKTPKARPGRRLNTDINTDNCTSDSGAGSTTLSPAIHGAHAQARWRKPHSKLRDQVRGVQGFRRSLDCAVYSDEDDDEDLVQDELVNIWNKAR